MALKQSSQDYNTKDLISRSYLLNKKPLLRKIELLKNSFAEKTNKNGRYSEMRTNTYYGDLSKEFAKRGKPNRVLKTELDTNYDTIIS